MWFVTENAEKSVERESRVPGENGAGSGTPPTPAPPSPAPTTPSPNSPPPTPPASATASGRGSGGGWSGLVTPTDSDGGDTPRRRRPQRTMTEVCALSKSEDERAASSVGSKRARPGDAASACHGVSRPDTSAARGRSPTSTLPPAHPRPPPPPPPPVPSACQARQPAVPPIIDAAARVASVGDFESEKRGVGKAAAAHDALSTLAAERIQTAAVREGARMVAAIAQEADHAERHLLAKKKTAWTRSSPERSRRTGRSIVSIGQTSPS